MEINGVINVCKEAGYTSHDVVAKLRGILHQKKIGHTGTLDPDATGVLPVCLGKGTRLCDMLTDHDKVYEAVSNLETVMASVDDSTKMHIDEVIEELLSMSDVFAEIAPLPEEKQMAIAEKIYDNKLKTIELITEKINK